MKGVEGLRLADTPDGVVLTVKAVPGASRARVAGVLGDALKLAVAEPPEKGKANAALAHLLAAALGVPARSVRLVGGAASARKEFLVASLSADQARLRLAAL